MTPPSARDPVGGVDEGIASRRSLWVALSLAAAFGLAELPFAAFMADDLIQLSVLERTSPVVWLGPLQLYTLSDGVPAHVRALQNVGAMPWFFAPDFKMSFFRPLSSGLLALDHAVFGLSPIGYRVHATLWFVALVAALWSVLRRALPEPLAAWSLVVFAISGMHASLFWIATRHVVVAAALGTAALAAHVRWREEGWRAGRALSIGLVALALSASEAAVAVVAYLVAYEALGARDARAARMRAVLPLLLLVAAHLALLRWMDNGVAGGGYLDPLREPIAFLAELPARWVFLVGALIAGGGADAWTLWPGLRGALAVAAGLVIAAFGAVLRAAWAKASAADRRGAGWLIAGSVASTAAFAGTPIGSRCLVVPMIGGSAAIALVLRCWWTARRGERRPFGRWLGAVCGALAVIHLVLAPLGRLATPYGMRRMLWSRIADAMDDDAFAGDALAARRLVVLRAPDFILGLHPFFFRTAYRLPMPEWWRTLSWAPCPHRIVRTAVDAFELETVGCDIDAPALAAGDVVELDGMRARVLARGARGPARVEFRFDRPLEDPGLAFFTWQGDRLQRVQLPPIAGAVTL